MAKTMAEVLAEHWSASTHADQEPPVDKCDYCGAVLRKWGDDGDMPAQLAAHQAAALSAAGYGLVRTDEQRLMLAAVLAYDAIEASALEQARAEAWDEGYTTGNAHNGRRDANPYRAADERGGE